MNVGLAASVELILERHLGLAWRAGLIDRSDEERMPLLRNVSGFARLYARQVEEGHHPMALFNQVLSDLGRGPTYHRDSWQWKRPYGKKILGMARLIVREIYTAAGKKVPARLG